MFIVFEGIDRCGKTTQSKLLHGAIDNSVLMRFPNRTSAIGQMINGYLTRGEEISDAVIHLLFAANRWEARETIQRHLDAGTTVVCDRYSPSGIAYGSLRDLNMDWIEHVERGLPEPDVVVYLDLSPERAAERGDYGAERYEMLETQTKVHEAYLKLRSSNWVVIDADRPAEEIAADIRSACGV